MIALIVLTIIVISIIFSFSRRNKYFGRINLKTPPVHWLLGNIQAFNVEGACIPHIFVEWRKKYGKTYGYYEGVKRVLVTSDVAVLNDVLVKQFANFHGRLLEDFRQDPDQQTDLSMFEARGLRWKRLRNLMSASFSMAPLSNDSTKIFATRCIEASEKSNGSGFDIYPYCQDVTLEVIAKIAFGEQRQLQGNPENPWIEACRMFFKPQHTWQGKTFEMALQIASLLPGSQYFGRVLFALNPYLVDSPMGTLETLVKQVVADRREAVKKNDTSKFRADFVQLLIDAETSPDNADEMELLGIGKAKDEILKLGGANDIERRLTSEEIVSQLVLFLIAGYDTTSNALAYTSYLLATNADEQQKVLDEIDGLGLNDVEEMTLEQANKMVYLDMVMKEALRMHPMVAL